VNESSANYPEKYKFINWWAGPDSLNNSNANFWYGAQSQFYPLINFSDNVVWQHKSHNLSFGGSFYREQDHYWNNPLGYDNVVFGDWPGDPMNNVFNPGNPALANVSPGLMGAIQGYYAILTGDIGIIAGSRPANPSQPGGYGKHGAVNLDELQKGWGLHFQDSWRVRPNLTVNYGLRWDFTGDNHDLNGLYFSPDPAGIFGVSGLNNLFSPCAGGTCSAYNPNDLTYAARVHPYHPWNVSPQPNVGIAWSPQFTEGLLGKLTGGGKTVLRAGYSLRRFTTDYQSFYNFASGGQFYYQNYAIQGGNVKAAANGFFPAGSLSLSNYQAGTLQVSYPATCGQTPYFVSPCTYTPQITEASQAFQAGIQGVDPNIKQPYIQSWNIGFQRELGKSNAIEIRYVGNRGIHEWIGLNPNEVNIFENGFLAQFKAAQSNLAINNASGNNNLHGSFAYNSLPGQQQLPIFQAAFAGEPAGADGNFVDYSNGNFTAPTGNLALGQVGSMANTLSTPFGQNAQYLCNLVPAQSRTGQACLSSNGSYSGTGGTYAENLFQANPYFGGQGSGYLTSAGYSNYNGLQFEYRQKQWHGMEFNANYTWSKGLAMAQQYTLHKLPGVHGLREGYGPAPTDHRHVANVFGTYDLPFGKGKSFLSGNGLLDRAVGGWTLGTVVTYTSGYPFQLTGGNQTFNNIVDGGIVLNGVTVSQIQHAIGLYKVPCAACRGGYERTWIDPKFIAVNGQGSSQIAPNTVPGTIGAHPWFYGMHHFGENLSVSKAVAIKESMRLRVQGEVINLFNHPEWDITDNLGTCCGTPTQVQIPNFGQTSYVRGSRVIEVRANFEF
jgi:hypothetical protein